MENHPGDTLGTRFLTFWGAIAAFFAFAVFAILFQKCTSEGGPVDPRDSVRLANTAEAEEAGMKQLETLGWASPSEETLNGAVEALKERKPSKSKMVAPGTETAAKLAAEAAASAPTEPEEEGEETGGTKEPSQPEGTDSTETPDAPETDSGSDTDPPA